MFTNVFVKKVCIIYNGIKCFHPREIFKKEWKLYETRDVKNEKKIKKRKKASFVVILFPDINLFILSVLSQVHLG